MFDDSTLTCAWEDELSSFDPVPYFTRPSLEDVDSKDEDEHLPSTLYYMSAAL